MARIALIAAAVAALVHLPALANQSGNSSCGNPPCGVKPEKPEKPGKPEKPEKPGGGSVAVSPTFTNSPTVNAGASSSSSAHAGASSGAVSGSSAVAGGGMGGAGGAGGHGGAGGSATGGSGHSVAGGGSSSAHGGTVAVGDLTTGPSTASVGDVSIGTTGGSATASGGAGGNASGASSNTTVTYSSNVEASRAAYAPDVLSAPTAPCRISIGGSAGWLGGAIGFGGSVLDEGCDLRETSRHLHNLGQQEASVQVMCLHDGARKALEAAGVTCKVTRDEAKVVSPSEMP